MTAAETVRAFEADLITPSEAVEQAMCMSLGEMYRKAAIEHPPFRAIAENRKSHVR